MEVSKKKYLYEPLELYLSEEIQWEERALVYHFFEIVQILEGSGDRIINENNSSYTKGDIFLFTPLDCRGFKSKQPTKLCAIRFSESLYQESNVEPKNTIAWLKQLEQIFYHHNRFESVVICHTDAEMIASLIANIVTEHNQKSIHAAQNIQHSVTIILNILSRNIGPVGNAKIRYSEEPLIHKILTYIKQNIGNSDLLRIKNLAAKFNLSQNYIGEYFKKLTGESLQKYVALYKDMCIKQRLLHSDYTLNQIADELGFTDASHLSRQFKKHNGQAPSQFKQGRDSTASN